MDGQFDKTIVNREKRSVIERIRSLYDDKTRYAQKRMLELLRPNSAASASSYGTEEACRCTDSPRFTSILINVCYRKMKLIFTLSVILTKEMIEKLKHVHI